MPRGTSGKRSWLPTGSGRCALLGVPCRLRMLSIFSTFDNKLKLTVSPQAERAETAPRQGTPTRAHVQPPDASFPPRQDPGHPRDRPGLCPRDADREGPGPGAAAENNLGSYELYRRIRSRMMSFRISSHPISDSIIYDILFCPTPGARRTTPYDAVPYRTMRHGTMQCIPRT